MADMKVSAPYIFKKVYNEEKIFDCDGQYLKLGYINIISLFHKRSCTFSNNDQNLLNLDFLPIADTRLTKETNPDELERTLYNWKILERFDSNDDIRHMGLLFLQLCQSKQGDIARNISVKKYVKTEKDGKISYLQIRNVAFMEFHLASVFVYVRKTPTQAETIHYLGKICLKY